ncbi:hypothetical protein Trco_003659 [Trichoderma cornu-damae]|uniref:Uncharacterized protein n=1 Tax=Trichoderma cornu-damae TaxID=654480 RepID=A0A9P8QJ53_9HYPO|nr:hypothetical protein Trco_003659 [Trichoderma cornu-damae]
MEPNLPDPDYMYEREWWWPWPKFELEPEDLFTTLHSRFNTYEVPLQSPYSFYLDVVDCALYCTTLEEFYAQMEERKAQRRAELAEAWEEVSGTLFDIWLSYDDSYAYPETGELTTNLGPDHVHMESRYISLSDFTCMASFDSMIKFFHVIADGERRRAESERRKREARTKEFSEKKKKSERSPLVSDSAVDGTTIEEAAPDHHERTTRTKPEGETVPRGTSISENSPVSGNAGETPRSPSPPSRATPTPAAESLLSQKRKRESDEDDAADPIAPQCKKQRTTSGGGEGDAESLAPGAGAGKPGVPEAASTAAPERPSDLPQSPSPSSQQESQVRQASPIPTAEGLQPQKKRRRISDEDDAADSRAPQCKKQRVTSGDGEEDAESLAPGAGAGKPGAPANGPSDVPGHLSPVSPEGGTADAARNATPPAKRISKRVSKQLAKQPAWQPAEQPAKQPMRQTVRQPPINHQCNPRRNPRRHPPVNPPVNPPINPPINSRRSPPINPPINSRRSPPINPPINSRRSPPINPPINSRRSPPINPPINSRLDAISWGAIGPTAAARGEEG